MSTVPDVDATIPQRRVFGREPWLYSVAAVAILTTMAMHALRPMVAYKALSLGATPFEVGLIAASYSMLSLVFALPIGRLADRIGAERFVVIGTLLTTAMTLVLAASGSLLLIAAAFVFMGLGQTITLVSQQTTVGNRGGRTGRDQRYGLYTTAASVGQLLGPVLLSVIAGGVAIERVGTDPEAAQGITMVFLACGIATGTAALIGLPLARAALARGRPAAPTEPQPDMLRLAGRVLRRPGMLRAMLVSTMVVSSIDVLVAYLPVYGETHGLSVGFVGILLTVRAAATLVSRLLMGYGLRRLGRRGLLTAGLVLAAVGMLVLAAAPPEPILVLVLAAFGLGVGIGQPITIGWVADQSPRAERATAIGIRLMGNRFALLTVPVIMGVIAGAGGIGVTFAAVAVLLSTGAASAFSTPALDAAAPDHSVAT